MEGPSLDLNEASRHGRRAVEHAHPPPVEREAGFAVDDLDLLQRAREDAQRPDRESAQRILRSEILIADCRLSDFLCFRGGCGQIARDELRIRKEAQVSRHGILLKVMNALPDSLER